MSDYESRETRYATVSVDRRAAYYVRAAAHIAASPQDFYHRVLRGGAYQGKMFPPKVEQTGNVHAFPVRRAS